MREWQKIESSPKDMAFLAWADVWHWRRVEKAYRHSDFNGHKDVVCRDGPAGPPFKIGGKDAPTHWMPLPSPPEAIKT